MPSPWKIDPQEAARMEAARDAHSDRESVASELRYYHAKNSPLPRHVRDALAVIDPAYDPDLPDEDD